MSDIDPNMSPGYRPDLASVSPSSCSRGNSFNLSVHFGGEAPSGDTEVSLTYAAWETGNPSNTRSVNSVLDNPPASIVAGPTENPKVVAIGTLSNAPVSTDVQITASANGGSASATLTVTS